MANQKFATYFLPSFPPPIKALEGRLQRESIGLENKWIPARARLGGLGRNDAIAPGDGPDFFVRYGTNGLREAYTEGVNAIFIG